MKDICVICGEKLISRVCTCGFDETKNYVCYRSLATISGDCLSNYKRRKEYDKSRICNMLDSDLEYILEVESNILDKKHIELLKKAYQRDVASQIKLGDDYYTGNGVTQSYVDAYKWYRMAATIESSEAMRKIGEMYTMGYGVDRDYKEALKWCKMAAEKGNSKAMNSLADMYYFGIGTEVNKLIARKWYTESAARGNVDAKNNVKKHFGVEL